MEGVKRRRLARASLLLLTRLPKNRVIPSDSEGSQFHIETYTNLF
jgi:hypothetical protein